MYLFVEFLLGGSDAEKLGDHQKNNFFPNNSAEALILLKEGYQGLLKLHLHLGGGSPVWGKNGAISKKIILFEAEK